MYYSKSSLEHLRVLPPFLLFLVTSDLPCFFPKRLPLMLRLSKEEIGARLTYNIEDIQPSQNDMFVCRE